MFQRFVTCLILLCVLAAAGVEAAAADEARFEIPDVPFDVFQLDNGLTVVVHEDRKAPIVSVNVWYHVGSKNEKRGKTGFAHLFEHLMFNGSENYNEDIFKPLQSAGATGMNGTTSYDRTNYFETVPTNGLDLALFLESDRMGHLLGVVDQEKLDEQRGVVQNEKRQRGGKPYAKVWEVIQPAAYPAAHPYSWSVIGSMEDLNAATLEDATAWFKTYYGAANAIIVLAGDIDLEAAKEKMAHYFGDIPSGPPVSKQEVWVAKRSGSQRISVQDRVPHARIYKQWNVPQWGTQEAAHLDLAARILGSGKTSRLHKRLVYDDRIATGTGASASAYEISGSFLALASAQPGGDLTVVEAALDEELARFSAEGPTEDELARVKTAIFANFVRRIEGVSGKSSLFAQNQVYGGDPGFYKKKMAWLRDATAEQVRQAAANWLSDGALIIEVQPFADLKASRESADRSSLPDTGKPPAADFPEIQRATLSNGLELLLAERNAVPLVELSLVIDAGYAADQHALAGASKLAVNMLDEGTPSLSALEISDRLTLLGARLSTGANRDLTWVDLSALKANLSDSLDLFADVALRPTFPQAELERVKEQTLARIAHNKADSGMIASSVLPRLIFGEGHPYALPSYGNEDTVASIDREMLLDYHRSWFVPNNSKLIVVGDTSLDEIVPLLEERLARWAPGETPEKKIEEVTRAAEQKVFLVDRPDSKQSTILAGHVAPPTANADETAIDMMNAALGGSFISRVNMNLREDKGWSYGVRTSLPDARGQRIFKASAPVQTDKTKESMVELAKEIRAIVGEAPVTEEEVAQAKDARTLTLPGRWERSSSILNSLTELLRFDYSDDYFDNYASEVEAVSVQQVNRAAKETVHPDSLVWVVVGDLSKIEAGVRELGFGEVVILDADGKPVEEVAEDGGADDESPAS